MSGNLPVGSTSISRVTVDRRAILRGAATAGAAVTGVVTSVSRARAEIWEEGDTQCRIIVQEKAPDYDIDDAFLADFMRLSEALTGVPSLDRRLGAQYLDRYSRHPDLTAWLPKLVDVYRAIVAAYPPPEDFTKAIREKIVQDRTIGPAAEQLIYLWYVSAFFLPADHAAASRNWIYGSPEQYKHALIWSVAHAHAPMTPGGSPNYWALPPSS